MKYKATIETLSPLHIGSGVELLANYDYKALESENVTFVFNQEAIYSNELAQHGDKADLAQPAASLIRDLANLPAEFKRYQLNGQARLDRLHAQMKDVYGGVYLPGSSLKGAIRNALMTYSASRRELSVQDLGGSAKEAARNWEREIFGDSPWSDILRLLQVADSQPVNPPPLEVLPVRVFISADEDEGSPIEVEVISAGATFESFINLDELTLRYANDPRLDWVERRALLANLLPILQEVGKRRIDSELAIARERGFGEVIKFYEARQAESASSDYRDSALLQIGWGTGWEGMTIGEALDKPVVDYLRKRYALGKPPGWNEREKGRWQPNFAKPFPKSHRFSGDKIPLSPLGWVKFTLTPVGPPRMEEIWNPMQEIAARSLDAMGEYASVRNANMSGTIQSAVPASRPASTDMVWLFGADQLPRTGDKFQSVVFTDGDSFFVSFQGLDFDTQAYGVLLAADNPNLATLQDGRSIRAEVLDVQKEVNGALRVRCKVLHVLPKG